MLIEIMFRRGLKFFRFTRWTIVVPLIVFVSLLYIKYIKNVELKRTNAISEDNGIQSLFSELEATTGRKPIGPREMSMTFKNIGVAEGDDYQAIERPDNFKDPRLLLEEVFRQADTNENLELDIHELARRIHAETVDHIKRAMRDNVQLFTTIDRVPSNGEVSWDEYHAYFLKSHGFSPKFIDSHNKSHAKLPRRLREIIMRDRARWAEAARNDPEKLALDEFLAFTHPESSHRALLLIVDDLLEKFDREGDEELTEDEFANLPLDGSDLDVREESPKPIEGSEDRRQEFRHLIDKNKDKKADRAELLMYIDPRNPRHAIQEAHHLIELADTNHDQKLSLSEVLSKTELFLNSKMVDTARSLHDEFR